MPRIAPRCGVIGNGRAAGRLLQEVDRNPGSQHLYCSRSKAAPRTKPERVAIEDHRASEVAHVDVHQKLRHRLRSAGPAWEPDGPVIPSVRRLCPRRAIPRSCRRKAPAPRRALRLCAARGRARGEPALWALAKNRP